ncbi:MAG: prepilin-type N-terminal cleavage/methylation domain-containing protein [Clostridia bacterium]|nr:prepilin-type N-terminal cleavage/methylation domain-containing protein [Clostridia bacterium]
MRHSKNSKGFSLVELIIVIAVLVALVAVIAPAYLRYVQRSHDSVLQSSAEEVLSVVRSEFALGNLQITDTEPGTVTVKKGSDTHIVVLLSDNLSFIPDNHEPSENMDADFMLACGVDTSKEIKSNKIFTITIIKKDSDVDINKPHEADISMDVEEDDG